MKETRKMNRGHRRALLVTIVASPLAIVRDARSQPVGRTWRIGFLSARRRPATLASDYYSSFVNRLAELGYREERNLVIEWRFAAGEYDRLPALAAELVRARVDAIVAGGPPAALAAKQASDVVPIVFVVSGDPVATGLVASLARPGGNVTGIANLAGNLAPKHLELLLPVVPSLSRIGVLLNPANAAHAAVQAQVEQAARKRAIAVVPLHAGTFAEVERAFPFVVARQAGAVLVALDPLFIQHTAEIAALAKRHRLPSVSSNREFAEAGGLMSYGQNQVEIYRGVADYVDRILKGTAPGALPVQQPTRLEFVLNLRTARELGVGVPASVLLAADSVVE